MYQKKKFSYKTPIKFSIKLGSSLSIVLVRRARHRPVFSCAARLGIIIFVWAKLGLNLNLFRKQGLKFGPHLFETFAMENNKLEKYSYYPPKFFLTQERGKMTSIIPITKRIKSPNYSFNILARK